MAKNSSISLADDYGRLGLLALASAPDPRPGSTTGTAAPSSAPSPQREPAHDLKPPELVHVVECPHPHDSSKRQTLALDHYERDLKGDDDEDEYQESSMVARRIMNSTGRITDFQLEIHSRPLQRALKRATKGLDYYGLYLSDDPVIIHRPFRGLFFLREPLRALADSPTTRPRLRDEINLLLDFIGSQECLGPVISQHQELVPSNRVSFDILWTLFPPYELVYVKGDEFDECFLVETAQPSVSRDQAKTLRLQLAYASHDGKTFGPKRTSISIPKFSDTVEIDTDKIPLVPLRFLDKERQRIIRTEFIARARTYVQLQKSPFTMMQHRGRLWIVAGAFVELNFQKDGKDSQVDSNGRVVVDATAAREMLPGLATGSFTASSLEALMGPRAKAMKEAELQGDCEEEKPEPPDDQDSDGDSSSSDGTSSSYVSVSSSGSSRSVWPNAPRRPLPRGAPWPGPPLPAPTAVLVPDTLRVTASNNNGKENKEETSDLEYIICQSSVVAFMLDRKAWVKVLVEDLRDIDWYPNPWDSLQLEAETKSLMKTLVEGFKPTEDAFVGWDDIVEGKGKGLIFLLHGLPGLGKTFTAETLAEETHRPLYQVSTGELSTEVSHLEVQLRQIFRLGWRWGAIVLIDEADVIMAERDLSDLTRSAIVAVFLRLVEYYRGLLFLTTNKVENFDPAFYNRIHAIIEYPRLDKEARTNVWKNLLAGRKRGGLELDSSWREEQSQIYDILGELEMNGRDIRNLIRAAYGVALAKDVPLGVRHIVRVLTHFSRVPNAGEIGKRLEFAAERTRTLDWAGHDEAGMSST